jgi:hypothetical protein
MSKSIYLIGSLRNTSVTRLASRLRAAGHDVFDDWVSAGPEADDYWQKYVTERGQSYDQALRGYAAQHVFQYDRKHLNRCDIAILTMPAGKSAHLELGYFIGLGKPGYICLEKTPERFDVMYAFADKVFQSYDDCVRHFYPKEDTDWSKLP